MTHSKSIIAALALVLAASSGSAQSGGTARDVQSPARPFDLSIVDTVKIGGSDTGSAAFIKNDLGGLSGFLKSQGSAPSSTWISLDPSKLSLATSSEVRTYFVGSSSDNHNTLGFELGGNNVTDKTAKLIFPGSSTIAEFATVPTNPPTNKEFPLLPGDFVNLGKFAAGTNLDFFMISDGAKKGTNVISTASMDKAKYVMAYAQKDSPYLILAFDELYKGAHDKDFNDLVIAVNIGTKNVQALTGAPEPATWAVFGTFVAVAAFARRRKNAR